MILTLLTTDNPDDAAESTFTSSIDSTYDEYMFVITALRTGNQGVDLMISFSGDGGSNYTYPQTTTIFQAYHQEDDSGTASLGYQATHDIQQGTAGHRLVPDTSDAADASISGIVNLYTPSNTTYVNHWCARMSHHGGDVDNDTNYAAQSFSAGYLNLPAGQSSQNAVKFAASGGNIYGTIQMYGVA